MIGDWIAHAGLLGLALLVFFVPGLLIGLSLRLRGLTLFASAPGISVGALSLLALILPRFGVRWDHANVALAVLIIAALGGALSLLMRRRRMPRSPQRAGRSGLLLLGAGLVIGGSLNAARLMSYIGDPGAISQTNDAVFHLNALRWVTESGTVSSLDITELVGSTTFYPAAWHAVTALVALETTQIPVAANLVSLVIAAVVWPMSVALLARVITRGDALVTALAAALSAGLLAFPQLMFEWGVLYPYALSLAIVPAATALAIQAVDDWMGARFRLSASPTIAALLAVAAITLSQPSALLVWGALLMLWLTSALLTRKRRPGTPAILRWSIIVMGWLALAFVWLLLAYLAGPVLWRPYRGVLGAVWDVFTNSHSLLPAAWGMSVLLLAGIVAALQESRLRWIVIAWVGVSALYVISAGTELPFIKRALTGPWYGDSFRLTAAVPIVIVPLASLGLAMLIRLLSTAAVRSTVLGSNSLAWVGLALIGLSGATSIALSPVVLLRVADETDKQSRYTMNDRSYLSDDEYAVLTDLPELVPDDALIIANPSTGAGFGYLLGEREVFPRTWSPPMSEAWNVLASRLNDAGEDDAVCEALAAYGDPDFVLDFGIGGTGPGEYLMSGMTGFDGRDGFEEIASEGEASLWRITACD